MGQAGWICQSSGEILILLRGWLMKHSSPHTCVCEHTARCHDDGGILLTLPPDLAHD